MFLDKKQGWCHIIVIVVPQGATRIVKIKKKGKVGKMQGFKRESCSAEKHAWKFLAQFRPRKVSPFPQSSLKFYAARSPANQERKSVRLYRHVRENWY